jgi:hypothetical protein
MQIQPAIRKKQKMRLALQGDSHSGKTLSALLIANGLEPDWKKIAVIDTEQNSASLYSHLGPFNVVQINAPFRTDKFYEAIELCEESLMEVIIIDSISSEWVGEGGILDQYAALPGDMAAKYHAVMPSHHEFIDYIQDCSAHVIASVRSTANRIEQQEGYAHHFTTAMYLSPGKEASIIKDRTGLFNGLFALNEAIGAKLRTWCNEGKEMVPEELQRQIDACKCQDELVNLLFNSEFEDPWLVNAFTRRRIELENTDGKMAKWQNDDI